MVQKSFYDNARNQTQYLSTLGKLQTRFHCIEKVTKAVSFRLGHAQAVI